jgi:hypothetical protein
MDDVRQHDDDSEDRASSPRPFSVRRIRETDLERAAVQIGAVAGHTYAALREARKILEEPGHGNAKERLNELLAAAQARAREFGRAAAGGSEESHGTAWDKIAELRERARRGFEQARERAKQAGDDHPLHVVLGAGVAGFLIGAALRARRSHGER